MRRKRLIHLVSMLGATLLIVGCATKPDRHLLYVGVVESGPALVSLGAGDSLGASIYANDIYLAARNRHADPESALADAPAGAED